MQKRFENYIFAKTNQNPVMNPTKIIFTEKIEEDLAKTLKQYSPSQIFVLCDRNTEKLCYPLIKDFDCLSQAGLFTIPSGDENKNIESLSDLWTFLSKNKATRKSVMINLGGGMITDLGGFAASTFKRGIDFINIPTTVLAAVDAAVGGKTGINFNGLKNEIGAFNMPKSVIFYSGFLKTLDKQNILSGYSEMLKHGLLSEANYFEDLLKLDLNNPDSKSFLVAIRKSVEVKNDIVQKDPKETSLRKALNLGHTAGHAFESLSHKRKEPVLHGYAVAWGLICELFLSYKKFKFSNQILQQLITFIKEEYGVYPISCNDYDYLIEAMTHDKKNEGDAINFTLLSDIGDIWLDQTVDKKTIEEMLDFYMFSTGS